MTATILFLPALILALCQIDARPFGFAVKHCPGHGSDIVRGSCPDCVIESDD